MCKAMVMILKPHFVTVIGNIVCDTLWETKPTDAKVEISVFESFR